MGIAGHILNERNLRRVNRRTGLSLDRAYIRGHFGEGRQIMPDGGCLHWAFDPDTWEAEPIAQPSHWSSCPASAKPAP